MRQRFLRFMKPDHPDDCASSIRNFGFFVWILLFSTMSLPALGQISIVQDPNSICNNTDDSGTPVEVTLTASGKPDATFGDDGNYLWYIVPTGGVPIYTGEAMNVNDEYEVPTNAVTFYVEYKDKKGKVNATREPFTLNFEGGEAYIQQGQNAAFCGTSELTLVANEVTGATYQWFRFQSGGFGGFQPIAGANTSKLTLQNSEAGLYTLRVTANACTATALAVEVTENIEGIEIDNVNKDGQIQFCGGDNIVLSGNQPIGNYFYRWQITNLNTADVKWSPISTNSYYEITQEDKDGAGISEDDIAPQLEYRIAISTYVMESPNDTTWICRDILSDNPVTLDKIALPKAEIKQINDGFMTVSVCAETDENGTPITAGGITLDAIKFSGIAGLEYIWYRSETATGAGKQAGTSTKLNVTETGYYYVQLDNGTCKGEESERIFARQLEYDPPFITVDGQIVHKDDPQAYICAGESSIVLKSNFEIPTGYTAGDFVYQWYQEVRAGKTDPEMKEIMGATSQTLTVPEGDVSATTDSKYQVTVRHKDCPTNILVRSKLILVKKLDINIEGELTEKGSDTKTPIALGKNQIVQLCPNDTYDLTGVISDAIKDDFGISVASWASAPINDDGTLGGSFSASTRPTGSTPGHFQAFVSVPGFCNVVAFITVRDKIAEVKGGGFCQGETTTLELEGGPFSSYSWRYSTDGITAYNEVSTTPTYETNTEGFYKVFVQDADCEFESDPFEVRETPPPTVVASVSGFPIYDKVFYCDNSALPTIDIALNPTLVTTVKYTWTKNDKDGNFMTVVAFEVADASLEVSENIGASEPAQYVLDVFAGGCDTQAIFTVDRIDAGETIDFISTLPDNPSGQTLCPGGGITPIRGGYEYVSPDFDFQWQIKGTNASWSAYIGATTDDGRVANLTSGESGIYRLQVVGCSPAKEGFTDELTIAKPPNLSDPIAINGDKNITQVTYCGDEGTASLSVPTGAGYSTKWFFQKQGTTGFVEVGIESSLSVGGVNSGLPFGDGVYYAEVTFNKICTEETQQVTVQKATAIPDITITADPKSFDCSGTVTLSTNLSDPKVALPYNFEWYTETRAGKLPPVITLISTEPTLPNVTVTNGSLFFVTVSAKSPSCTDPKVAKITIDKDTTTPPELYITPKKNKSETAVTACDNVVLSVNGVYKNLPANHYTWTLPNSSVASGEELTAVVAGNYAIKVIDSKGCELTDSVTLTLSVPTQPILDTPQPRSLCPDGTVILSVINKSVGGKYVWKKDDGSDTFVEDTSLGNAETATVSAGRYVVTYEAINCPAMTSDPIDVTSTDEIKVVILNEVEICKTGSPVSVTMNTTTADPSTLTYLWEKQENGNFIPAPSPQRITDTYEFTQAEIAGTTNATEAVYRLAVTRGGCTFYSNNITVRIVESFDSGIKLQLTESDPRVCATDKAVLTLNGYAGKDGIVWESFIRPGKAPGTWIELTDFQDKITAQVDAGKYRVFQTSDCGIRESDEINVGIPSITEVKIIQAEALKKKGETIFKYCGDTDMQVQDAGSFPEGTYFDWFYNSAKVGTGASFTLTKTSLDGIYTVKAIIGSCELEATINVEQTNAYDRLEFSATEYTLCKDGTVGISVSYPSRPSGSTVPTYEWRFTEGTTEQTFATATVISGATDVNYTFAPADSTKTHYVYVRATSPDCGVVDAAVKVNPAAPNMVTYKINQDDGTKLEFCTGTTFTLSTPNYGAGFIYTWQKDNGSDVFEDVTINSSTSANELITDIPGIYRVGVAPSAGCVLVETDTVQVYVVDAISGEETASKPTKFCSDQTSTTLSAPGLGSSGITGYAWFKSNNKAKTGTYFAIGTGVTYTIEIDSTLDIPTQIEANSGWYRVDVTYSCGQKSYFMEVEISAPPSPESVRLNVDGSALLKYCTLGSDPGVTLKPKTPETSGSVIYQWQISTDAGATYTDISATNGGQNTTYKATDTDGNFTNATGTFYRLKAIGAGCEIVSTPIQIVGSQDDSDAPVLANSGDLQLCIKPDETKEFVLTVQKTPGNDYEYQWVKYKNDTDFDIIGQGKGLVEFTVSEIGQYAVGVKTDCDAGIVLSAKVQINDVPEATRVPLISELEALSGLSEIKYCQTDGVTLNIGNPNKAYDYIWVKEDVSGFTTVISGTDGLTVTPQDSEGNVQLVIDNTSTGGNFAVYLKRKSCPAVSDAERSRVATLTPVDDISTITPKPKIGIEGKTGYDAVHRLCSAEESATMIATLGNYTYQWQKQDESSTFQNIAGATSDKYSTNEQGIYRVLIISTTCGTLESDEIQIDAPGTGDEAPSIEFEQGEEAPFCANADIKSTQLSLALDNMDASAVTIVWEKSIDNVNYEEIIVSGLTYTAAEGYYRVTAINEEGCVVPAEDEEEVVVRVFPSNLAPEPEIATSSPTFFCGDGAVVIRAASVSPSDTLQWLYAQEEDGVYALVDFATANEVELTANRAGFYKLRITSQGCGVGESEETVQVIGTDEKPNAIITQGAEAQYCLGGDVILDVKAQDLYNYQWFYSETAVGEYEALSGFFGRSNVYPANQDGYYKVKVFFNGCQATSDSIHVTASLDGIPTPEIVNGTKQAVCQGESLLLETTTQGSGYYYFWSYSPTIDGQYTRVSVNTPEHPVTDPGFYQIVVGREGCGESVETVEVYQIANRPEAAIVQSSPVEICSDNATILESTTQNPDFQYEWRRYDNTKPNLTSYTVVEGIEGEPYNFETNVPGFYRVFVSNQGCGALSEVVEIKRVLELSAPEIIQAPLAGFCPGEMVTLEAELNSRSTTYTWKYSATRNGTYETVSTGRGTSFRTYPTNVAGFYKLEISQPGCSAKESASMEVQGVNEPPESVINDGVTEIQTCQGEIVELEAKSVPRAEYQWDGPEGFTATGRQVSLSALSIEKSGVYTLTTNILGCSTSAEVNIQVNELPKFEVLPPNVICTGDATGIIELASEDATLTYKFGENGELSDQNVFEGLTAGTYQIFVQNPAGCEVSQSVTIQESDRLGITLVAQDVSINRGNSVQLNVTGANNYLWDPEEEHSEDFLSPVTDQNPWVFPLGTTTYTVKGNSPEGCGLTQLTVTVNVNNDVVPTNIITPNGDGANDTWVTKIQFTDFPDATIQIYDRWGKEIQTNIEANYKDDWRGTDASGAVLPTGAYRYVITPQGGDSALTPIVGTVTIIND